MSGDGCNGARHASIEQDQRRASARQGTTTCKTKAATDEATITPTHACRALRGNNWDEELHR
eukprot:6141372-Alexandrium_andersonii.AAC.1